MQRGPHQLCQHANRPGTLRVHRARHLQRVGIGQVGVCGAHRQNEGGRLADVVERHARDLLAVKRVKKRVKEDIRRKGRPGDGQRQ